MWKLCNVSQKSFRTCQLHSVDCHSSKRQRREQFMSSHLSLFPFCLYNENGNGVYFFKYFLFPQLPPLKTANRFEDRKRGVLFILFYPLQVNWKKLAFTPLLGGRGGGGEEGYLCRRRSEAALLRRWRGASLLHRTEGAQSGPV